MQRRVPELPIIALIVALGCLDSPAQVRANQLDRGGEWLSWTDGQRATHVSGFISGYREGVHSACEVAEKLFTEPGKMYRLGDEHHPSEMPSARCLARMGEFSKARFTEEKGPDLTLYTDPITEFYSKHPDYEAVPFDELLLFLADGKCDTADQLYQRVLKGEIHRLR